ncbi:hypothetical protein [Seonamhaeicola sp.]|uniref:hypothetical protein n=1 Tax=Seonamhaeicola sp. TaxID=1912245 RepID=UPI002622187A|nr:hypothetical protein [Seonamhaeicola sp.]
MNKLFLFLLIVLLVSCKTDKSKVDYLGVANLDVTGHKDAIPLFEKGLLLLHSFEYVDAREAFLRAQEIDPDMPMAYWGEAMTYNHSLWRNQKYEEGFEAVKKIKAIEDIANLTPLEQDLIKGLEILYKPKTPKQQRDHEYMEHLKGLNSKYPDNHEVGAFYSLSLLGSVSEGRNDSIYGLGADIAKKILKENAKHPGALHYLIHSYDDPGHAALALEAANSYAVVAPDASHALHMPSHIFVALGMWDRVIASNIDSYEASVTRMQEKGLDNDARGYHAYHWLEYGYLQKQQLEEAEKMVWDMQTYCNEKPSKRARAHLLFLKGTFLVETDLWDHDIVDIEVDVSDLNITLKAQNFFINGMKAYKDKNGQALDKVIEAFNKALEKEALLVQNLSNGFSVCASVDRSMPDQTDIEESNVMKTQLLALQSWLNDDMEAAEKLLKASVQSEDQLSYSYGPPFIKKPTKELYGEFLISQEKYAEAITMYKGALKRGPKRLAALSGMKKSAALLGDDALVKDIDLELSKI